MAVLPVGSRRTTGTSRPEVHGQDRQKETIPAQTRTYKEPRDDLAYLWTRNVAHFLLVVSSSHAQGTSLYLPRPSLSYLTPCCEELFPNSKLQAIQHTVNFR